MAQPSKPVPRPDEGAKAAMRIDAELVRELAELLTENALTEIEVADGDRVIRVARNQLVASGPSHNPAPASTPTAPAAQPAPAVEEIAGETVKSPMVGTNPITAPSGGIVKTIMVADAQPVEFDQPLVIVG